MVTYKEFREEMLKNLEKYYHLVNFSGWKKIAEKRISGEYTELKAKTILDCGCGWGEFIVSALKHGAEVCVCLEPDADKIRLCRMRFRLHGVEQRAIIIRGIGEYLPFKDNSFDLVISNSVLEHVQEPCKVIKEMVRVSKKYVFIHCPNYLFPREQHYKVFWLPCMPKNLAKIYLRARKKNPNFITTINYITPISLKKCLSMIEGIKFEHTIKHRLANQNLIIKHKFLGKIVKILRIPPDLIALFLPNIDVLIEKV